MKRPLRLSLAIGLALSASHALALGLGPVRVKSKLNQPLDAEIPVIQGTAGEAEGLLVGLATAEDFDRIGLNRSRLSIPLDFAVIQGDDGNSVIKVTSKDVVRDPYLDFLLEANWPKGRLLREYTILLDLPGTAPVSRTASTTAPPSAPPATTPPNPTTAPRQFPTGSPATQPAAAKTTAHSPAHAEPAREPGDDRYGPVESGDTLSAIARETRVGRAGTVDQMMLALYKANPNAFYNTNINALKRGVILRVPSNAEIKAVGSAAEATAQVRAQFEDWRGARANPTRIAGAGTVAPATEPSASSTKASATPKAGASAAKDAGEHLALVPPKAGKDSIAMADTPGSGVGAGSAATTNEAKAELARTREALTTAQQEATELKSRVKDLEGIQSKSERILSLKDSEIAELQQKLKKLQEQSTAKTMPAGSTNGAAASTQTPAPSTATPVASTQTPAPSTATPATSTQTPTASTAPAPPPAATTGTPANPKIERHDIWGDVGKPATAADAGKPAAPPASDATPPDGTTTSSTTTPQAPPANAASSPPETTAQPAANTPPANAANNRFKPKPEPVADQPWYKDWPGYVGLAGIVFLLVGFFIKYRSNSKPSPLTQHEEDMHAPPASAPNSAEENTLRKQLRNDPANLGLYLELLSLYYASHSTAKFEKTAIEMYTHIQDPQQEEWIQAQAMGRELAPQDPLYATVEYAEHEEKKTEEEESAADPETGHANRVHHPYFNTATDTPAVQPFMIYAEAPASTPASVPPLPSVPSLPEVPHPIDTPAVIKGFDFNNLPPLDLEDKPVHVPASDRNDVPAPSSAFITPPAVPTTHVDDAPHTDTIDTKLDLAKAYLDMGDPDGARSMLEEVVTEGNDTQKAEAQRLMAEID
jgi:pilus assembly protein FimV